MERIMAKHNFSDKALLLKLKIRQWSGRKFDRDVSKHVDSEYNAEEGGRYNKLLVAKERLDKIRKLADKIKGIHMKYTLPWHYDGVALCPSRNYLPYMKEFNAAKEEFYLEVDNFIAEYTEMKEEAKQRLGRLYREVDYPGTEREIREKYSIECSPAPWSDPTDFRLEVSSAELEEIEQKAVKRVNQAIDSAKRTLYHRLMEPLERFYDNMKHSKKFKDSSIETLRSVAEMTPSLNLTNEYFLDTVSKGIIEILDKYPISALRHDPELRKKVAEETSLLIDKMKYNWKEWYVTS